MTSIAVSTGGFTPEIWSEKLNIALVYHDIVNRDYEGEIKNKGDKVYFYTLGNLTVRDYAPNATGFNGLTFEDPTGDKQYLEVNGKPLFTYSVSTFNHNPNVDKILLVADSLHIDYVNFYAIYSLTAILAENDIIKGSCRAAFDVFGSLLSSEHFRMKRYY